MQAKERAAKRSVPYRPVKGFTLKEKSVEEMAQEKAKNDEKQRERMDFLCF